MKLTRRHRMLPILASVTAAALVLGGCSKTETTASSSAPAAAGTSAASTADSSAGTTSSADASSAAGGSAGGSAATSAAASQGAGAGGSQVVQSGAAGGPECTIADYGLQPFDLKGATVGFSQSEKEDNPFRIAETQSIKDEAAKLGITLQTTNAQSDLTKQISDIQDLLNQGVKLLIVAPLNSDGLEPAFSAAKAKGVPVITIDRKVTLDPCKDYVSFLGSNFTEQGHRAAKQMITALGGQGKVAILLGSAGNNVTDERTKGFTDEIAASGAGIEIVAQQTGDFARDKGQQVTEQLIQSNPDINGIYAENDEMGIGAVNALEAAGKSPGTDVKMVSIDGTKNAVQLIVDGKFNAVIESNPRFGPLAFQTALDFTSGKPVGQDIIISDTEYDAGNAAANLSSAY